MLYGNKCGAMCDGFELEDCIKVNDTCPMVMTTTEFMDDETTESVGEEDSALSMFAMKNILVLLGLNAFYFMK